MKGDILAGSDFMGTRSNNISAMVAVAVELLTGTCHATAGCRISANTRPRAAKCHRPLFSRRRLHFFSSNLVEEDEEDKGLYGDAREGVHEERVTEPPSYVHEESTHGYGVSTSFFTWHRDRFSD